MARDLLDAQVVPSREFLKSKWNRLTDDDIRQINGSYEQLVDKLQERYGYTRAQVEEEIRRWNAERETKTSFNTDKNFSDKPYARQEDRTVKTSDDNYSFLKWAALALPFLLLALYYGAGRTPEETTTAPRNNVENVTVLTDTPADQTLAQTIRQAFMNNSSLFQNLQNIRISTSNGVVTITGSVATAQEKDRISNFLEKLGGVRQVNNQLDVR